MGNSLKSANSLKSKKLVVPFRDYTKVLLGPQRGERAPLKLKPDLVKYGYPVLGPDLVHYKSHTFNFNQKRKIANWTMELINHENFLGKEISKDDTEAWGLRRDMRTYMIEPQDFVKLHNGTFACSELHKHDRDELMSTRNLTNIIPMRTENVLWTGLELLAETLINKFKFKRVWICSGPLFMPVGEELKHLVTTQNFVHIPTHLFKIFVAQRANHYYIEGFKIENFATPPASNNFWLHTVPIKDIELSAGHFLFPNVDTSETNIMSLKKKVLENVDERYMKNDDARKLYSYAQLQAKESLQAQRSQSDTQTSLRLSASSFHMVDPEMPPLEGDSDDAPIPQPVKHSKPQLPVGMVLPEAPKKKSHPNKGKKSKKAGPVASTSSGVTSTISEQASIASELNAAAKEQKLAQNRKKRQRKARAAGKKGEDAIDEEEDDKEESEDKEEERVEKEEEDSAIEEKSGEEVKAVESAVPTISKRAQKRLITKANREARMKEEKANESDSDYEDPEVVMPQKSEDCPSGNCQIL